jgi:diguanylate cyclase (GGDEF)-like protein
VNAASHSSNSIARLPATALLCEALSSQAAPDGVLALLEQQRAGWAPEGWAWYLWHNGSWTRAAMCGLDVAWDGQAHDDPRAADWPVPVRCWETGHQKHALGWLAVAGSPNVEVAAVAAASLGALLLRQHAERLQAVQDVMCRLTALAATETRLESFLPQVHAIVSSLIDAENFYVALYNPVRNSIRYPYYVDSEDPEAPDPTLEETLQPDDLSLTGWVIQQGEPLLVSGGEIDALAAAGCVRSIGKRPEFWMGAPLKGSSDQVIGVVAAQTYHLDRLFGDNEQRLFLLVTQHIALALERIQHRAMLETQVARRTEELTQLNSRLQEEVKDRERAEQLQRALYQIAELAAQPIASSEFYARLHAILGELVYAKNCFIALYDEVEDLVSFPYYMDERVSSSPPRKSRRGVTEYVIRQQRPVLLTHKDALRLMEQGEVEFISVGGGEEATSWLGVPLYEEGQVCGVIVIQSYDPDVIYGETEVALMTFVSHHIGNALARKRAYQELERRVHERTQALDAANARLKYENLHDALTGLPNRTQFMHELMRLWADCAEGEKPFIVMFVDLDRFKHINDTLGHLRGDSLLVESGKRLKHCLRDHDMLARLGGDEFAVLLPDVGEVEVAEHVAHRIAESFDQPIQLDGRPVFTSCSIGIVCADRRHHRDPQDILRDADVAMYQAKARGRDCYVVYNRELRERMSGQLDQESSLRKALKCRDELVPFVQPIVDGASGRIIALEALIRWNSPDGRWIVPAQFLALAENTRLIHRVDHYMLEWLCDWLAQAPAEMPPIHLNCSGLSMVQPSWAATVLGELERRGIAPARLQIEVTEDALLADPVQASRTMARLQAGGVRVVLDDFGTGYASLSYLHQYQFDAVKIDKSFVLSLESEPKSAAIISSVLLLARALKLDVVAEGVETAGILRQLAGQGAMHLQGYLFARPLPIEELDLAALSASIRAQWEAARSAPPSDPDRGCADHGWL